MARMVNCIKLQREAEGLDFPPYPGPLGQRLFESVSKEAWQGWLEQRHRVVLGLGEHATIEFELAQLAIEQQARLAVGGGRVL